MTVEQAKQLTEAEFQELEREAHKQFKKYYKLADKTADENDEIDGQHWEEWASDQATNEVFGSEEAYFAALGE